MRRGHPWDNRGKKSSRIIVKSQSRKDVKKRVAYHKGKGYVPLMEIKEDYTFQGEPFFVCVMEIENSPSV